LSSKHTLEVIENEGELGLELTEELCSQLGWKIDDVLEWSVNEDGTVSVRKVDKVKA